MGMGMGSVLNCFQREAARWVVVDRDIAGKKVIQELKEEYATE
jgi:hypothetical protein